MRHPWRAKARRWQPFRGPGAGLRALGLALLALAATAGALLPGQPPALAEVAPPDALYAVSDVVEGSADRETPIPPEPLPEYVPWLLAVAQEELGYAEGPHSYTKYGEWAGDPNAEWCAEFLCWCVSQVDQRQGTHLLQETYPLYGGQNTGRDWFIARGRFVYRKGNCPGWGYQWLLGQDTLLRKNGYIPQPGDWVFFSYNEAGDTEHVAMVEYCALDEAGQVVMHVLEGNNPSSVQRNSYKLDNSQVLGFGTPTRVVGTTMRSGNRGEAVLQLQQALHQLGYLAEKHLTGSFGGHTKAAVAAFQQTIAGKAQSGIADMETQNALSQALLEKEFHTPDTWLVEE